MNDRSRDRRERFRRSSVCVGCVLLPIVGLADVRVRDGKAILLPGSGGVIVRDWFAFCRWVRRRRRAAS